MYIKKNQEIKHEVFNNTIRKERKTKKMITPPKTFEKKIEESKNLYKNLKFKISHVKKNEKIMILLVKTLLDNLRKLFLQV